jgi:hypothetical protein
MTGIVNHLSKQVPEKFDAHQIGIDASISCFDLAEIDLPHTERGEWANTIHTVLSFFRAAVPACLHAFHSFFLEHLS